jgi:protein-disulfide isomerase
VKHSNGLLARIRIDPYFAAGLLSILLVGAVYAMRRSSHPQLPLLHEVPAGLASALDSLGVVHRIGSSSASVRVAEFADYQCPACAASQLRVGSLLDSALSSGVVQFTAYEYPLPMHGNAIAASIAAECVAETAPSAYWAVRDRLFRSQKDWEHAYHAEPYFAAVAGVSGGDSATVARCVSSSGDKKAQALQEGVRIGLSKNVVYTPLWIVNDSVVPTDSLLEAIQSAIATAKSHAF